MDTSPLKAKVLQEIDQIPANKLSDVLTFLHYFRLGLERSASASEADAEANTERIMQFAGSWNDLSDQDFSEFVNDVKQRRRQAFSTRRSHETSSD